MEINITSWKEKLEAIPVGKPREMAKSESKASVYSCIREHFPKGSFAVRTDPITKKRFILRIK